jgi:hypothetical protein
VPDISRFFGIVIKMFFDDHNPPHFHAEYAGSVALVGIRTLAVFSGRLPPRAMGLVIEWATLTNKNSLRIGKERRLSNNSSQLLHLS